MSEAVTNPQRQRLLRLSIAALAILLFVAVVTFLRRQPEPIPAHGEGHPLAPARELASPEARSVAAPVEPSGASAAQPVETPRIVGRVIQACGQGLPTITVVAMAGDATSTAEELLARTSINSRLRFTTADAAGEFSIEGVDASRDYAIFAGGPGFLARDSVWRVRVGAPPVELLLDCVYGIRFRLADASGSPLQVSPGTFHEFGRAVKLSKVAGLTNIAGRRHELALVLAADDAASAGAELEHVFAGTVDATTIEAGEIRTSVPGYQKDARALTVARVYGAIPEEVIRLERDGSMIGKLRLVLRNCPWLPGDLPAAAGSKLGTLRLGAEDKRTTLVDVKMLDTDAPQEFALPCGSYSARFMIHANAFRFPHGEPLAVTVGADSTATIEVDLTSAGVLLVTAINNRGAPFSGPLTLRVAPPGSKAGRFTAFSAPPYVIPCVERGIYEVGALMEGEIVAPGGESFLATVEILAGQVNRVTLTER